MGPAIHKFREGIAALFDPEEPLETAEDLTQFACDHVGEHIKRVNVGMAGANFVLAESGSIAPVTNEGNARKCAVAPDMHVALAGIEKILPSVEDLSAFANLIAKAAGRQDMPTTLSLLTPSVDSPTVDFDAPDKPLSGGGDDRKFHLVLLDNSRTKMRDDDDLRETLYCIRCDACTNSCANFQQVGGHAFGGKTYTGGITTAGRPASTASTRPTNSMTSARSVRGASMPAPWISTSPGSTRGCRSPQSWR